MARLVPAVLELRIVGIATMTLGAVRAAWILGEGEPADLRAAAAGLAGSGVLLWVFWGARTVRTAIRLALPAGARWSPGGIGRTAARALAVHVAPVSVLAIAGAPLVADRVATVPAIAAGVLAGTGVSALLAAQSVRRAEVALRRRLLREPRVGAPLGRRSLYLEPQALRERPAADPAAPWPAHRPPPREQASAIELDPVNHAARHAVGVRSDGARALRARRATAPPPPGERPGGGGP